MPITYEIATDLNLLVYIFHGDCHADEYFALYHSIHKNDPRRVSGMNILMDIFSGSLDFNLESFQVSVSIMAENRARGLPRDRVAILTRSTSLTTARDALRLLGEGMPIDLEVFHTVQDAIIWLQLQDREKEAAEFLQYCREK